MHSFVYRLNTLVTFAAVLLAVLCGAASFLDAFNSPSVRAQAEVIKVFVFLAAEYETSKNSLNQISLWDYIIPDKDHAKFQAQVTNKYPLIDQGSNLRGKKVEFVLHWHVMPRTGRMIEDKIAVSNFYLPVAYA